jgi:hypothetical protein
MKPLQPASDARLSGVFPACFPGARFSGGGPGFSTVLGLSCIRTLMSPVFGSLMFLFLVLVFVELIGDVMLCLHQMLLKFLLGIAAAPCSVPQFTR